MIFTMVKAVQRRSLLINRAINHPLFPNMFRVTFLLRRVTEFLSIDGAIFAWWKDRRVDKKEGKERKEKTSESPNGAMPI